MNSVYPPNHFGYSGAGGPSGPGGGTGAGGFPTGARAGPGGPHSPMLNTNKMGVNMNNMSMMSRVGGVPVPQGGQTSDDEPKVCAGCGVRIVEKTLLHSMERYWHEACLRCTCCGTNLADSASCFIKSGMILCKPDYVRSVSAAIIATMSGQFLPSKITANRIL